MRIKALPDAGLHRHDGIAVDAVIFNRLLSC